MGALNNFDGRAMANQINSADITTSAVCFVGLSFLSLVNMLNVVASFLSMVFLSSLRDLLNFLFWCFYQHFIPTGLFASAISVPFYHIFRLNGT